MVEEISDKLLQDFLKSSLSDSTKNLAWYNAVSSLPLKALTIVEVGVGGEGH